MEITLESIISLLGLFVGGGGGCFFTWRWMNRRARAEAKEKEADMVRRITQGYPFVARQGIEDMLKSS